MRYFCLLLFCLFVSFGVAFMVLFRGPGLMDADVSACCDPIHCTRAWQVQPALTNGSNTCSILL